MPIGAKVTLRKTRMYEFLDRLVTIALPRVRDFRGLNPKSFDGRGNYASGIKEHIVFPEINYDKVEQVWGMDIIVCTTAKTDDEARALLRALQLPVPAVRPSASQTRTPERHNGKEELDREEQAPRKLVKQYAGQARRACRRSPTTSRTSDGGALRGAPQARRAAAQLVADPHPQPLRGDGPSARLSTASSSMSRIALRELGSQGLIPGLVKSSW